MSSSVSMFSVSGSECCESGVFWCVSGLLLLHRWAQKPQETAFLSPCQDTGGQIKQYTIQAMAHFYQPAIHTDAMTTLLIFRN